MPALAPAAADQLFSIGGFHARAISCPVHTLLVKWPAVTRASALGPIRRKGGLTLGSAYFPIGFHKNLKAQKLEEDSGCLPSRRLSRFGSAGATQKAGPRLEERLATVQALLGDDLRSGSNAPSRGLHRGRPSPATDAARHLVVRGGKRVRPTALMLSAACFGGIPSAARELAVVSKMVHSTTLLGERGRQRRRTSPEKRRPARDAARTRMADTSR